MSSSTTKTPCPCNCPTYGQHLRNKNTLIAYTNSTSGWDYTKQGKWDRELERYRGLRSQGIEPEGTTHREMDKAERELDV